VERFAADSSRTTHGAEECIDACRLLARIICRALLGRSKDEVLLGDADSFVGGERVTAIAHGSYREKPEADIHGSGYVVQSLEAALWVFARTHSFADAVLMAANLGNDADTTAAVCGQVVGAYTASQEFLRTGWSDWHFVLRSLNWPISLGPRHEKRPS
jgi:ADP-ribosyl-[dinitrogen reductase] hydrolase